MQIITSIFFGFFVYVMPALLALSLIAGVLLVAVLYTRALREGFGGQLPAHQAEQPVGPEPAYKNYFFHRLYVDATAMRDRAMTLLRGVGDRFFSGVVTNMFTKPLLMPVGMVFGVFGAAAAFGAMSMFVVLALLHTLIVHLVGGAFFLIALYVRGVEEVATRLRGAEVVCPHPDCYRKFRLAHYRCPTCGVLHKRLVPGPYGLFERRCQCGTVLPAGDLTRRDQLRGFCPHCERQLPPNDGEGHSVHIPMVGGRSVGKSTLFTRIVMVLEEATRERGQEFIFPGAEDSARFAFERAELEAGRELHPTVTLSPRAFLVMLRNGAPPATPGSTLIYMYDVAGEVYQQAEDERRRQHYLRHASGFLFLIDPFSLPAVRTAYRANLKRRPSIEERISTEPPQDVYDRFISTVRSRRSYGQHISVIITKTDLFDLRRRFGLERDRAVQQLPAVRQWLIDNGEANLVMGIEKDFEQVGYFASSLEQASHSLRDVLEPVHWILGTEPLFETEPPSHQGRAPSPWLPLRSRSTTYGFSAFIMSTLLLVMLIGGGFALHRYAVVPLSQGVSAIQSGRWRGPLSPWSSAVRLSVLSPDVYDGCTMHAPPEGEAAIYDIFIEERVDVLARSRDGVWYKIRNETGDEGWVHQALFPVSRQIADDIKIVRCNE